MLVPHLWAIIWVLAIFHARRQFPIRTMRSWILEVMSLQNAVVLFFWTQCISTVFVFTAMLSCFCYCMCTNAQWCSPGVTRGNGVMPQFFGWNYSRTIAVWKQLPLYHCFLLEHSDSEKNIPIRFSKRIEFFDSVQFSTSLAYRLLSFTMLSNVNSTPSSWVTLTTSQRRRLWVRDYAIAYDHWSGECSGRIEWLIF